MTKFKVFLVESVSTERNKPPLDVKIQKTVEDFLASDEGGEMEKVDIVPQSGNGPNGRAFVTVYFKPNEAKKKEGGKK